MAVSKTACASLGQIKTQDVAPLECKITKTTDLRLQGVLGNVARRAGKSYADVDWSEADTFVAWDIHRGRRVTQGRTMADVRRNLSRSGYTLIEA